MKPHFLWHDFLRKGKFTLNTIFCPNCGTHLAAGAQFCPGCGSPVSAPAPVAAPTPAPAAPPAPAKAKKVKKTRRTAGISILCVLMGLCVFLTIGLLTLRTAANPENLGSSVQDMVLEVDLTQIPASELITNAEAGQSMAEYIAQEIQRSYVVEIHVDEEDVQTFLEDSEFMPFIAEKLGDYVEDVRNDRRGKGISEKELSDLMWDNRRDIEKLVGIPLTQTDIDNVIQKMDEQGLMRDLRAGTLKSTAPAAYTGLQIALSDVTIIVLAVLMVLMTLLIAKGYGWNICRSCGSVGMTLLVGGGIFLVLGLAGLGLRLVENSLISYLIGTVLKGGLTCSVVIFVLGAILVAVDQAARKSTQNA